MTYDAIIIGGGHNGLVAAAYLARAGCRVLVLERRSTLGGAAATEPIFPGYRVDTGAESAGLFCPEIFRELKLAQHGLQFIDSPATAFVPDRNAPLTLWRDPQRTASELATLSPHDAAVLPRFVEQVERITGVLRRTLLLAPPDPAQRRARELAPWLRVALHLRRLGRGEMMDVLRVLPLTAKEWLDEWFETPALQAIFGVAGVTGSQYGPEASGTAFQALYQSMGLPGGFKSQRQVRGGIGELAQALARAAEAGGATIRTGAAVVRIIVHDGVARSVVLSNGDELEARVVLSNLDPRTTFFDLVGTLALGPQFVRRVRNLRFRGATAKICLALQRLPEVIGAHGELERLQGRLVLCPSLDYLERASDAAKYGQMSPQPVLDVSIPTLLDDALAPPGRHLLVATLQYAPFHLRESNWQAQREPLGDLALQVLATAMPDIRQCVAERHVITPADWQQEYGLAEGSLFHGEMALDQLLFMRPVAGWGQYRTPIAGLYLCGAGSHPGGGVTGAPGHNAAQVVLRELR